VDSRDDVDQYGQRDRCELRLRGGEDATKDGHGSGVISG